ncbi:MAG: ATP-binding protein, partial [Chloroflexota bacterium]
MFLKSIEYTQFEQTPKQWKLEGCTLGAINLIVGKNATGKSRTLNIIKSLANLLAGEQKLTFISGDYEVVFNNDSKTINFSLKYQDNKVIKERLDIDGKNRLDRGADGSGTIYYEKEGKMLDFQTPQDELASVVRRDSIQHPFLQDLNNWGKSLRHYNFGTDLG